MKDLLFLHGAIGAESQFQPLQNVLKDRFNIHTLNFSGHGGKTMHDAFSIEQFASEVLAYLDSNNIATIRIFGYSMGGYVALYLAKFHSERINGIFTLATKLDWTPEIAERETKMLNADKIAEKIPAFAAELKRRHEPNDWRIVLQKTTEMMVGLGNRNPLQLEDFKTIENPIRIAIGDKDAMVSLEETIAVYRNLPNASFIVLPDTQHPIEKVDVQRLADELGLYFS